MRHKRNPNDIRFTVCGCEVASRVKVEMLPYTPAADCPYCLKGEENPKALMPKLMKNLLKIGTE